jgi:hypothetical protein
MCSLLLILNQIKFFIYLRIIFNRGINEKFKRKNLQMCKKGDAISGGKIKDKMESAV